MSGGAVWVFHRGALGDSVLLWPMLRAMRRAGRYVVLVADRSKGALAAAETGVTAVDAEQGRFNQLWREDAKPNVVEGVVEVVSWEASAVWDGNARAMFPGAAMTRMGGRPDALFARQWTERGGGIEERANPRGPVVAHVGAGSDSKRWPLERFVALTRGLVDKLIAGEVEAERFGSHERDAFRAAGGLMIGGLDELAGTLRGARLVIACDSGSGHMAAQLGVPTLSLFGPTDPARWAPVGPRTRVVAPAEPKAMEWLAMERVRAEALGMLAIS